MSSPVIQKIAALLVDVAETLFEIQKEMGNIVVENKQLKERLSVLENSLRNTNASK